jgi:hypothetical protein
MMSDEQRYVVKLASGEWITGDNTKTEYLRCAHRDTRAKSYGVALDWEDHGAVALRLKPGKRAAEMARLEAENDELLEILRKRDNDVEELAGKLDAMTAERDAMREVVASVRVVFTCEETEAEARVAVKSLHAALAKLDEASKGEVKP